MKSTSFSVSVSVFFAIILTGFGMQGCKNQQWEPLFNGENLEGWSIKCIPADRDKEYWTVKEACIVCNSTGDRDHNYVWLATNREFTDFHLKLRFQVFRESAGNSGIQFRSRYDDSDSARHGGWLSGPQADIHGPLPFRTGLIYDETEDVRRWIHPSLPDWQIAPEQAPETALLTKLVFYEDDPDAWNSMEIICRGMRVKTLVNGNPVCDFDATGILDDELHKIRGSGISGCIAFQLHSNDELKIKFKSILIKEL
jgi:hypothetical protein